jgi:hypothetical protein
MEKASFKLTSLAYDLGYKEVPNKVAHNLCGNVKVMETPIPSLGNIKRWVSSEFNCKVDVLYYEDSTGLDKIERHFIGYYERGGKYYSFEPCPSNADALEFALLHFLQCISVK